MEGSGLAVIEPNPVAGPVPAPVPTTNAWAARTAAGTSPWKTNQAPAPCSLADVMSEELAKELQEENKDTLQKLTVGSGPDFLTTQTDDLDVSDDLLLAQMLQREFDLEHDQMLRMEERKVNGDSRVTISFENYRMVHPAETEDSSGSDVDLDTPEDAWDHDKPATVPKRGYTGKGQNMVTKHDAKICGQKNSARMMQFPPDFHSGDSVGMVLPNHVYNTLKVHSYKEDHRSHRVHDKKEISTAEQAIDPRTRLLLYKLVNAEILECINGSISTGKEACVFHAFGGKMGDLLVPNECAIKVFKTTLNEFRTRDRYIKEDFRFKDRFSKLNPRKIIKLWAEKEMHNLNRMRRAGIPCPEVVLLRKHILVMSFIGQNQQPAKKLKDIQLSADQWQQAYAQCLDLMCRMYRDCHLIHADLSEYNMLWHNGQIWFIDVSQSVEPQHPHALEFLYRDCRNVCQFFSSKGVPNVPQVHQLFNKVSEMNIQAGEDKDCLEQIQTYEKKEEYLSQGMSRENFAFDYFFERSKLQQEKQKAKQAENSEEDDDET
ncbi:serine/threonine-protein kinase RIO3-like [Branchiostoma floridae]|uniref:Serine/threonine-protein kinase RIO3 n=1 Tax=Branchiostoma floridae TaxID=7739 RepID=A0A9J7HLS6_BRAFL|nr:serine/threonine-protein kinase RIO3-like [Branchiostoma floridae]